MKKFQIRERIIQKPYLNKEFEIMYGTGRKQCCGSGAFLNPGSEIRIRYLG